MILPTIGYHGCSREKAQRLLAGEFVPSDQPHDWLGDGLYFWERGPGRAEQWARQRNPVLPESELQVVAAEISLENCLDLTDVHGTALLQAYLPHFERLAAKPLRANDVANKRLYLDGAFIRWTLDQLHQSNVVIDVVRAAYAEGDPLVIDGKETHLQTHNHVQLCVRSPRVLRWLHS